eukprot:6057053-Amphidinium_carterae.1
MFLFSVFLVTLILCSFLFWGGGGRCLIFCLRRRRQTAQPSSPRSGRCSCAAVGDASFPQLLAASLVGFPRGCPRSIQGA